MRGLLMFSRRKMNIVLLVLSVVGSQVGANDTGYLAQAKQKASHVRDWSVETAGKVREKANDAYAVACQKARALYEKAKENKLMTGAIAYLAIEAILKLSNSPTLFGRIFLLPTELNNVRANNMNLNNVTIPGLNTQIGNLNGQLNNANNVIIPGLNANIANLNNVVVPNLNNQVVNLTGQLNTAHADLDRANQDIADIRYEYLVADTMSNLVVQEHDALQEQLNANNAHLERQNELDTLAFGIVVKNVSEQIQQLNARIDNKEIQNQEALQTLRIEQERALGRLNSQHETALEAQTRKLLNEHAAKMQVLIEQHQQELEHEQNMGRDASNHTITIQRNHAQAIQDLKARNQANIESVRNEYTRIREQAIRDLTAQYDEKLQVRVNALINEHEQARQVLQDQLEQAQQEARQLQKELHEYKGYAGSVEDTIEDIENVHQRKLQALEQQLNEKDLEVQQLNDLINNKEVQINELTKNYTQEIERNKQIQQCAFDQGTMHVAMLEQKHDAVRVELDKLDQELQPAQDQVIDSVGIIKDLMTQARELVVCRNTYPNVQKKLSDLAHDFDRVIELTQKAINHVVDQINTEAGWLKAATEAMHFDGITKDNFEQNLAQVHFDLGNYFGQLNNALDQLGLIVGFGAKNEVIQSCLATCNASSVACPLSTMLAHSFDKVQKLLPHHDGNIIVVNSYDKALNLYAHSLAANDAYQSYIKCCSMMLNSQACFDWAKPFEEPLSGIINLIYSGGVQVQEPFNSVRSTLGNSVFFNELNSSMLGVSQFNLDQSEVNNFDLDEFLNNPIDSGVCPAGSFCNSVVHIDNLLKVMAQKDNQDWEDEFNAMNRSVSDWQKSLIASKVQSSLFLSNMFKSGINIEDASKLSLSVVKFKNSVVGKPCPFVGDWVAEQERLARQFGNHGGLSLIPNVPYIDFGHNSDIAKKPERNNTNLSENHHVSDSIFDDFIEAALKKPNGDKVGTNNSSDRYSAVFNDLGGASTNHPSSSEQKFKDSLFEAEEALFKRNEQERLEKERIEQEKKDTTDAAASNGNDSNENYELWVKRITELPEEQQPKHVSFDNGLANSKSTVGNSNVEIPVDLTRATMDLASFSFDLQEDDNLENSISEQQVIDATAKVKSDLLKSLAASSIDHQ